MKQQDDKLTLQETEHLCRQYMDCNLSVLEETELRYFLTEADYHSPLIDEVRDLMNLDTYVSDKPFVISGSGRKFPFRKGRVYLSIAACVAILIGTGLFFRLASTRDSIESQSFYLAYVDGHRLSDEAARLQIEAEKKTVDDFINEMSELEARNKQMIDNFFNP